MELLEEFLLYRIEDLYKNKKVKAAIRSSVSIEIIAVFLTSFFTHEKLTSVLPRIEMRNMLYYVYQNFLILIDYVLLRLPPKQEANKWASRLAKVAATN